MGYRRREARKYVEENCILGPLKGCVAWGLGRDPMEGSLGLNLSMGC